MSLKWDININDTTHVLFLISELQWKYLSHFWLMMKSEEMTDVYRGRRAQRYATVTTIYDNLETLKKK